MKQYVGNSASGQARQHNGDVYNDCTITHIHPEDQSSDLRSRCLQSLAFPHMEKRGDISAKADKTCEWIYDDPAYINWTRSRGLLWINGRAGTGKSTIMESVVSQKRAVSRQRSMPQETPQDILVASFFFHRRGDSLQRTTVGLFRSLLHQILRQDQELLSEFMVVTRFQQRCNNEGEVGVKWDWTASDLCGILNDCIVKYAQKGPISLYVDALDESGESTATDLMDYFHQLRSNSTSDHLSMCISCRPYPDVVWAWDHCIIVESGNAQDIITFVHINLRPAVVRLDQSALDQIRNEIVKRASGVFQWVVLVTRRVRSLSGENTVTILADLEKTPTELSDLYESMLAQLHDSDRTMALPLLRWVTFSSRPLSLTELRYAVAMDERKDIRSQLDFESSRHWCNDDQQMVSRIRRLSQGLVSVVKNEDDEDVVQFDHESVQDYMSTCGIAFLEGSNQNPAPLDILGISHHHLTLVCIYRLRAFDVVEARVEKLIDRDWYSTAMPFARYATDHWTSHAQIAEAHGISQADLIELTEWPSNTLWSSWSIMLEHPNHYRRYERRTTLQHVASRYGLCSVLARLMPMTTTTKSEDQWLECATHPKDDADRTPLFWAARGGHDEAVKLLLTAGASIDSPDSSGQTPLQEAVVNGHGSVMGILLAAGANVSVKDSNGRELLALAVSHGKEDAVRQLLAGYTKVDARDDWGQTALHEAVWHSDVTILRLLLAIGKANPDIRSAAGFTPLLHAASYGMTAITKLLLASGEVDVNARDERNRTPLLWAAQQGHESVVKLLLEMDKVDVNARDKFNMTPLRHATQYGHRAIVRLLLETGKIYVNAGGYIEPTPLFLAANKGDEAIVKLLLETEKADVNARNDMEQTPLSCAAWGGHEAIVKLLLETDKVDVNAPNRGGWTPLFFAAVKGSEATVKLLLSFEKVDVNLPNEFGRTPLLYAARENKEGLVRLLLSCDRVDVNLPDKRGRTPLWCAAEQDEEGVVRLLLSCDKVDIHARDYKGRTALEVARRRNYQSVVRLLEEAQEQRSK